MKTTNKLPKTAAIKDRETNRFAKAGLQNAGDLTQEQKVVWTADNDIFIINGNKRFINADFAVALEEHERIIKILEDRLFKINQERKILLDAVEPRLKEIYDLKQKHERVLREVQADKEVDINLLKREHRKELAKLRDELSEVIKKDFEELKAMEANRDLWHFRYFELEKEIEKLKKFETERVIKISKDKNKQIQELKDNIAEIQIKRVFE